MRSAAGMSVSLSSSFGSSLTDEGGRRLADFAWENTCRQSPMPMLKIPDTRFEPQGVCSGAYLGLQGVPVTRFPPPVHVGPFGAKLSHRRGNPSHRDLPEPEH